MKRTCAIAAGAIGMVLLTAVGCQKKVAVAPPPAPKVETPEAPKPVPPSIVAFAVEPSTIERGQSANLRWEVKDATRVEIDRGIGVVAASAQRRVAPEEATTYRILATGPGGEASAT